MNLYEVIRWGNDSDHPLTGGADGEDTCFLVRATSVEEAARLVDRELSLLSSEAQPACAAAVYLLGSELGSAGEPRLRRGPHFQHAYRYGRRHWYRGAAGDPWVEKALGG